MTNRSRPILMVLLLMLLAILACNVGGQQANTQVTVQAVYATITAQSAIPTVPTETPTIEASPTSTPTETATVSPTPPEARSGNGVNFTIPRCQQTINVDAQPGDWDAQPDISAVDLGNNTYGAGEWVGRDDLSGQARFCWITSTLYLYVDVTDDVHVQTQTGRNSWKGDELEMVFDGDLYGDFYEDEWSGDDRQLGLSPGDFNEIGAAAVQYWPRVVEGLEDVTIAVRQPIGQGGSYVIEVGIAWSILGVTPAADQKYGFCLALNDNDHVNEARQDSMVSHCTRLRIAEPDTWVTITLGG